MRRVIAILCSVALLGAVLAPAALAARPSAAAPIRGVIVDMATYGPCPVTSAVPVADPSGCWYGHVVGDINGVIAFWEDPPGYGSGQSAAFHFFEKFTFFPDSGGWFAGYDDGHWSQFTKFHASGFVTSASQGWVGMVGYRFYEMGVTTCNDVGCTAYGTELRMSKAAGEPLD